MTRSTLITLIFAKLEAMNLHYYKPSPVTFTHLAVSIESLVTSMSSGQQYLELDRRTHRSRLCFGMKVSPVALAVSF